MMMTTISQFDLVQMMTMCHFDRVRFGPPLAGLEVD
jgi:hypothetical protein